MPIETTGINNSTRVPASGYDLTSKNISGKPVIPTGTNGKEEKDGDTGATAQNVQLNSFIQHSGVNLPWGYNHTGGYSRYGWDVGKNPWGGADEGFSVKRAELDQDMALIKTNNMKYCRVFIFCDFRTGLVYDGSGNPTGFDSKVYPDMSALVDSAKNHNIKLIPVLTDYLIADGLTAQGGLGEHPEFITNDVKRAHLIGVLRPFVRNFGTNETIAVWDVMNEPEEGVKRGIVSQPQMKVFLNDLVNMVKQEDPGTPVSIGHKYKYDLNDYAETNCPITQVHYYDEMAYYPPPGWDFNSPASSISSNKNVFFGEVQPSDVEYKLQTAATNGYTGVLFWSLHDPYARTFADFSTNYHNWTSAKFREIHSNLSFVSFKLSVNKSNISASISPTYEGNVYSIERCTNGLVNPSWQTISNIPAAPGVNITGAILPINKGQGFFRAVVMP